MNKYKNKQTYYIVAIIVTIIAVVGFSYAYFAGEITNTAEIDVTLGFEDGYLFYTEHDTDLVSSTISDLDMFQAGDDKLVIDKAQTIRIGLTNTDGNLRNCTYDLVWHWEDNSDAYTITPGANKEFTIFVNGVETQLPNSSGSKVVYSGAIHGVADPVSSQVKTEEIRLRFYNLVDYDQSAHANKTYTGYVKAENIVCSAESTALGTLSNVVLNHESDEDYTSTQDGSVYRVVDQNGVRYEGANPDNYVYYNNELWRIIGTFEGSTIGLESGKYYTKIIRANVLDTTMAWNTSASLDWSTASLRTYLNGDYYNSISTSNRSMIANATWYLGAVRKATAENYTTLDWYNAERGTLAWDGSSDSSKLTSKDYITILQQSDWGYSMYTNDSSTACDNTTTLLQLGYGNGGGAPYGKSCYKYSWLISASAQRLLNTSIETYSGYFLTNAGYGYMLTSSVTSAHAIRPTLYLEDEVVVTGGNGSENNPYKITKPTMTLSGQVIALENGTNEYTNSEDGSKYLVKQETVTATDGTKLNAGVRYEGANPNNFVEFNGELWRIIGTFDGNDIGGTSGRYYTKIIRNEYINNAPWDCTNLNSDGYCTTDGAGENDWTNATLNIKLNNDYLNQTGEYASGSSIPGLSASSRAMVINATWYLRGFSDAHTHKTTVNNLYLVERLTGDAGYRDGTAGAADASTKGFVGLMYPSDYVYAIYSDTCDNYQMEASSELSSSGCLSSGWLESDPGETFFITPWTQNAGGLMVTSLGAKAVAYNYVGNSGLIKPTVYLNSNVVITSGDGSESNPYKLELVTKGLAETILANNDVNADNVASKYVSSASGINFSAAAGPTNGLGLYYTSTNTENNGTTYYFRGEVDNNYVKFGTATTKSSYQVTGYYAVLSNGKLSSYHEDYGAFADYDTCNANINYLPGCSGGSCTCKELENDDLNSNDMYWRIVRINEDGSVRLIYNGIGTTGRTSTVAGSSFDVGYMSSSSGSLGTKEFIDSLGNGSNSALKTATDNWYVNNMTGYADYLADAGFCSNREIGSISPAYDHYISVMFDRTLQFNCPNDERDLFTLSTSSYGNKKLTYPVGAITANEAVYAGYVLGGSAYSSYLDNGLMYWTMTPNNVSPNNVFSFGIGGGVMENGGYGGTNVIHQGLQSTNMLATMGVRPVINVKGYLGVTGSGTADDPYVIQ